MINKIGNWVFGSFFRTIGRLLVFILLGVIIANLVDFGTLIDNFRITDLFFEKVNAEEIGIYEIGYDETYYLDSGLTQRPSSNGWYDYTSAPTTTSLNNNFNNVQFYFNNQFNLTPYKGGYITIPFELSLPQVAMTTTNTITGGDYCERWDWGTLDSYNNVTRWNCARYATNPDSTITDREYIYPKIALNINIIYTNGYVDICSFDNSRNIITCPITKFVDDTWGISRINIDSKVYYHSSYSGTYYIYIHRKINAFSSAFNQVIEAQNQNTNAINNQTQQQQQQHQELMDDNTTQADAEGQDFINNFNNNSHGLTGIITAPLSAIQSLASATCSPLVLPLPFTNNKSLTLPCMNSIYTQYFGAFYTMYQGIILALISYWVCVRLFTLVKGFKDPEDDKIEVMDL